MATTDGGTPRPSSVVLLLLVVLGALTVGVVAIADTATAQSGEIVIDKPIYPDQSGFKVGIEALDTSSGQGCVVLEKNGQVVTRREEVEEGDVVEFTENEVNGIQDGDVFTAWLTEFCDNPFASDEAQVTATGSVVLQDPIYPDESSFEAEVTELHIDASTGCLDVFKNGNFQARWDVTQGDVVTISESDVGGTKDGDVITTRLFKETCEEELDSDSTTVTATGRVVLEDPIYADQTSFTVDVSELRTNTGDGCVVIDKNGQFVADRQPVEAGQTLEFTDEEVNGIESGDDFIALLGGSACEDELSRDSTLVTEAGTLDLDTPIVANQTQFDVTVTELHTESEGCVVIDKNGQTVTNPVTVLEGDTVTFTEDEVDGIAAGDDVTARLGGSFCEEELDADQTTVQATGSVHVEDSILEGQTSFQVEVRSLHIQNDAGCIRVDNSGGGETIVTGVTGGETRTIRETDVGSFEEGDVLTATLVDQSECDGTDLDIDSTTVTLDPTATPSPTPEPTATPSPSPTPAASTPTPTAAQRRTATETEQAGSGGTGGGTGEAQFEVTIDEVRVSDEGVLVVNATIENTGGSADTQTVVFRVDGEERDSEEVTLESRESLSVRFTDDSPSEAQQRNIEVASEDDADEEAVQHEERSGRQGGLLPEDSAGLLLLLLLLLALLLAYYYVRRRRYREDRVPVGDEGD